MPTKITVIYDNPIDPTAFESRYAAQLELARAVPLVTSIETAKVWPKEDGSATPAYRFIDLYFDDYDTACKAVTTDPAGAFINDVFELATGGVRITFADVEKN
jgi:uncharacterized protein (TIGR02118 family)